MKLRQLTSKEIKKLASRSGVKRTGVENFLGSIPSDYSTAVRNLDLDRRTYKWNTATYIAILDGIDLARKEAPE